MSRKVAEAPCALPGTDDALRELLRLEALKFEAMNAFYKHRTGPVIERCPHKVGDIVECNGYAFEGKSMKIAEIFLKEEFDFNVKDGDRYRFAWHMRGKVLKADGTPGERDGERFEFVVTDVRPFKEAPEVDL